MSSETDQPKPGAKVVLLQIPPGFLNDLPTEDQQAIEVAAKGPLDFNGYDDEGRAELEFTDSTGVIHFIYVEPVFIHQIDPLKADD